MTMYSGTGAGRNILLANVRFHYRQFLTTLLYHNDTYNFDTYHEETVIAS